MARAHVAAASDKSAVSLIVKALQKLINRGSLELYVVYVHVASNDGHGTN